MTARQRATIAELRHVVNSCCKHGLRELTRLKVKCVNEHADADRVVAWLRDPDRKPAIFAFTEGPERRIASVVEVLL